MPANDSRRSLLKKAATASAGIALASGTASADHLEDDEIRVIADGPAFVVVDAEEGPGGINSYSHLELDVNSIRRGSSDFADVPEGVLRFYIMHPGDDEEHTLSIPGSEDVRDIELVATPHSESSGLKTVEINEYVVWGL